MEFETLSEYDKDLKKLLKKYSTLSSDLEDVKKVLSVRPEATPHFSYRIDGLGLQNCVIKVQKIACDSFKGRGNNSGLRLVYAYFKEIPKIVLVEIYHKSEKENEDSQRILGNFE